MSRKSLASWIALGVLAVCAIAWPAHATTLFSTGFPDNVIGMASRPPSPGLIEIEAADDFVLSAPATITGGHFFGVSTVTGQQASIVDVVVSFYNIFPVDSTNPPSGNVPTRNNSPADDEFASRSFGGGTLGFALGVVSAGAASNSVLTPNQATGGDGPITGVAIRVDFTLLTALTLPAGHYFFVPQAQVDGGQFFWLSAPRPIVGGTGPFVGDLQTWMRDDNLAPDWLRVGMDIVDAGAFNGAFQLDGTIPEPSALALLAAGLLALVARRKPRPS